MFLVPLRPSDHCQKFQYPVAGALWVSASERALNYKNLGFPETARQFAAWNARTRASRIM